MGRVFGDIYLCPTNVHTIQSVQYDITCNATHCASNVAQTLVMRTVRVSETRWTQYYDETRRLTVGIVRNETVRLEGWQPEINGCH